jgi:hypothetical protein
MSRRETARHQVLVVARGSESQAQKEQEGPRATINKPPPKGRKASRCAGDCTGIPSCPEKVCGKCAAASLASGGCTSNGASGC